MRYILEKLYSMIFCAYSVVTICLRVKDTYIWLRPGICRWLRLEGIYLASARDW